MFIPTSMTIPSSPQSSNMIRVEGESSLYMHAVSLQLSYRRMPHTIDRSTHFCQKGKAPLIPVDADQKATSAIKTPAFRKVLRQSGCRHASGLPASRLPAQQFSNTSPTTYTSSCRYECLTATDAVIGNFFFRQHFRLKVPKKWV